MFGRLGRDGENRPPKRRYNIGRRLSQRGRPRSRLYTYFMYVIIYFHDTEALVIRIVGIRNIIDRELL